MKVQSSGGSPISTYEYDALSRRIEAGGAQLIYSAGWQVIEERSASTGAKQAQYLWSPVNVDGMILRDRDTDDNGTLDQRSYALHDANFNVTALANSSGGVIERFGYDPYGKRAVLNADWTPDGDGASDVAFVHGHQGLKYDEAAGLYDSRLRPYDPELGRFTSPDPVGYLDGMSRYQGYGSSPGNFVDPAGLNSGVPDSGFVPLPGLMPPPGGWGDGGITLLPAMVGMPGKDVLIDFGKGADVTARGEGTAGSEARAKEIKPVLAQIKKDVAEGTHSRKDEVQEVLDAIEAPGKIVLIVAVDDKDFPGAVTVPAVAKDQSKPIGPDNIREALEEDGPGFDGRPAPGAIIKINVKPRTTVTDRDEQGKETGREIRFNEQLLHELAHAAKILAGEQHSGKEGAKKDEEYAETVVNIFRRILGYRTIRRSYFFPDGTEVPLPPVDEQ